MNPERSNTRILVAEDNPVNQRLALVQLESLGFEVDVAPDGVQALDALSRATYDAVLMDCEMPVMNGFDATRELRRRELSARHIPVIAMSAHGAEDRQRCLDSGMDDYIAKPVDVEHLGAVLDGWLSGDLDTVVIASLRGLERTSRGVVAELVAMYADDSSARIRDMARAAARKEATELSSAAHALKSSAGSIGAKRVRKLAASLERLGDTGTVDGAQTILDELREENAHALNRLLDVSETVSHSPVVRNPNGSRDLDASRSEVRRTDLAENKGTSADCIAWQAGRSDVVRPRSD